MTSNAKSIKSTIAPLDIARETFKQMALRRVEPTPENYQLIYNELAGISDKENIIIAIKKALKQLPNDTVEQCKWISRWEKLLSQNNWDGLPALLSDGMDISIAFSKQWPDAIRALLKSMDARHVGLDLPKKKEALERVLINFGNDFLLAQKIQGLANSWMQYGVKNEKLMPIELKELHHPEYATLTPRTLTDLTFELSNSALSVTQFSQLISSSTPQATEFQEIFQTLQDMFRQSLYHGLIQNLDGYPEINEAVSQLYVSAEKEHSLEGWKLMAQQFNGLMQRVQLIDVNEDGLKHDLLRLLKLLIDNISELVSDDQWFRGQIAVVQNIISSPLDREMILDVEDSLKKIIFKQGALKLSLSDAKNTLKNMIVTFVDRLGHLSDSTDTYQAKVGIYANRLSETEDIMQINALLESLVEDTQAMQNDIIRSRETLLEQRDQVESSQDKIRKLQEELTQLSETVRIDQLTGVLNRRGLDDAMIREIARAQRGGEQLCVALLDIDNFKNFNDTYGHHVGDSALQHLAKVIQQTVRPTDIAARFGGEEFVILLPDTTIDQAIATITRLQRALTKQFFLGNNERLLITFSAGVSLFKMNEDKSTVLNRADQAMYMAKKSGKNRVMTEVDLAASE